MKALRLWMLVLLATAALPLLSGCKKSYPVAPDGASINDKAALIADLKNKDQATRGIAAGRLGSMGPAAQDAVPELEKAVKKEKVPMVKLMMQDAIKKLKGG